MSVSKVKNLIKEGCSGLKSWKIPGIHKVSRGQPVEKPAGAIKPEQFFGLQTCSAYRASPSHRRIHAQSSLFADGTALCIPPYAGHAPPSPHSSARHGARLFSHTWHFQYTFLWWDSFCKDRPDFKKLYSIFLEKLWG